MSVDSIGWLVLTMLGLAALPSASVALVVAQSVTGGTRPGLGAALGIMVADLVFVLFALAGLSVIASSMGALFAAVRYGGAAYLIWMGLRLILDRGRTPVAVRGVGGSFLKSFLAGLFLTFGDLKAIFFYASLLPQFVELRALGSMDVAVLIFVTILSVGGVKCTYVFFARSLVHRFEAIAHAPGLQVAGGGALAALGGIVIAKS